jgi:DNA-directed RNA polymerase subunit RPC12/RpoP
VLATALECALQVMNEAIIHRRELVAHLSRDRHARARLLHDPAYNRILLEMAAEIERLRDSAKQSVGPDAFHQSRTAAPSRRALRNGPPRPGGRAMTVAPNHSGNLPRDFAACPRCGKKGLYRYGGWVAKTASGRLGGHPPGRRCKYCGHRILDVTQEEFERWINRAKRTTP